MKNIEEIIEILKGKKEIKISIFCGAGISVNSGLPATSVLLEYILECLGIERTDIKALKNEDGKWSMPLESFMDAFLEHDQKNTTLFNVFLLGKPNCNHFLIKKLAINTCLDEVYTTNFDLLIEHMFETDPKLKFKVILENDAKTHNNSNGDNCTPIIKLHGTADKKETIKSTILSITSGEGFENRKRLIRKAFNSISELLWFWGYSFSDVLDISPAIEFIQPKDKTVIFLNHDPSIKEIDKAVIIPLNLIGEDHPLNKFNGCMIQVDSDSLVQSILGRECNIVEEIVDSREWRCIIEKWIDSFEYMHVKYSILCHLFSNLNQLELALKYNNIAIKLNKGKDKRGEGAAFSNRGRILNISGEKVESINMFREALKIFKKIEYKFGVASNYINIGYTYGEMGKVELGLKYLKYCRDYIKGKKFKEVQKVKGYLARSKGELYVLAGKFTDAEVSFFEAIDIFQNGYKAEESDVLMQIGKLYRLTGRIERSNKILNEALDLAKRVGNPKVMEECSDLLSDN